MGWKSLTLLKWLAGLNFTLFLSSCILLFHFNNLLNFFSLRLWHGLDQSHTRSHTHTHSPGNRACNRSGWLHSDWLFSFLRGYRSDHQHRQASSEPHLEIRIWLWHTASTSALSNAAGNGKKHTDNFVNQLQFTFIWINFSQYTSFQIKNIQNHS